MAYTLLVAMLLCLSITTTQSIKDIHLLMRMPAASECLARSKTDISDFKQDVLTYLNCLHYPLNHNLSLIVMNETSCQSTSESGYCLLQTFFQTFFQNNMSVFQSSDESFTKFNTAGIITTEYHMESEITSSLLSRYTNATIPLIYASSVSNTTPAAANQGIFYMSSSSFVIVDAFLHLLKQFNWTRIGIVSDKFHTYFSETTQFLQKEAKNRNITISLYFEPEKDDLNFTYLVQHLSVLNIKIIFLSMDCHRAYQILNTAYMHHLTWPKYAWIIHSIQGHEMLQCTCDWNYTSPTTSQLLNGVIFINQDFTKIYNSHETCGSGTAPFPTLTKIDVLSDAINTVAMAAMYRDVIKGIAQTNFSGVTGRISFVNNQVPRKVIVTQMKNNTEIIRAFFDSSSNTFQHSDSFFQGAIPDGTLPLIRESNIPIWFTTTEIAISLILVTVICFLYLYYRNEPEIKATSVPLSMLIFTGCYFLLFFLIILTIEAEVRNITKDFHICTMLVWLSGLGLPLLLIFATLFVKMLRIYHIFNLLGKVTRLSMDCALIFFILLILSPNIFILVLFSSLSSYSLQTTRSVKNGYIESKQTCVGESDFFIFVGLLVTYLLLLMFIVALIAIKTRRIRIKEFRETKTVNALIFVMILLVTLTLSYWLLFDITSDQSRWKGDAVLHIGHVLIVASCQVFLFIPKIFPPLKRSINSLYITYHK